LHIDKFHGITGLKLVDASKMMGVIVGSNHKIFFLYTAMVTTGRDLQF